MGIMEAEPPQLSYGSFSEQGWTPRRRWNRDPQLFPSRNLPASGSWS